MNDETQDIGFEEHDDHCAPSQPQQHHEDHDDDCKGEIVLHCNSHCHQLRTRSFVINVAPQTEAQLRAFMQNTFNAWQNANYLVMAHSVIDTGSGWTFTFTVGYYI